MIAIHPIQRDCSPDDPEQFAAWCWAAGIPDPSPVRPYPIPLIGPMLAAGVSNMLWDFGFRHHPELQTKWIEGTAGLATMAKIVSDEPDTDGFESLAKQFLAEKNPKLLEKIRACPDAERKQFLAQLEKSVSDLSTLISLVKEGDDQ